MSIHVVTHSLVLSSVAWASQCKAPAKSEESLSCLWLAVVREEMKDVNSEILLENWSITSLVQILYFPWMFKLLGELK